MTGGVIGHRGPNKTRNQRRENQRHWQSVEDHGPYREAKPTPGLYPCTAKNCEFDAFSSPETLEMHVRMRHSEAPA